ncbi:MAG TPA: hypothetical protein VLS89_13925, partial [Candidatus Nanopelagicales bacterium]|nr:hypothetical protein [Candidatus Nanopelagicales bacterium]
RDEALRVGGARRSEIGGDAITVVGGNEQSSVAGARIQQAGGDAHEVVSGEMTIKVGGAARIVAGTREQSDITVQGSGELRLVGAGGLRLHSPTSIELTCGTSRVVITPEGITLKAKQVLVEAEDDVTVQRADSKIKVGEAVEAESATVKLTTSSASLKLDPGGAELRGNPVALKGPENAQRSRPESQDATPGEARFKVEPPSGHEGPLTLVIATPSGEMIERQTDGNHEVVLEGFEGEEFEIVEVRLPGGERLQHLRAEG